MRTLIIYHSFHHGNTKKIALAMAAELNAKALPLDRVRAGHLSSYDLIGFGSGTFFWKHHKALIEFAKKLPRMRKKVFIFSTRGIGPWHFYHRVVRRLLKKKGYRILGEFSSRAFDTAGPLKYIGGLSKGRPNRKDLKRAREFVKGLLEKARN